MDLIKEFGALIGIFVTVFGVVYGYGKLNSKVDSTENKVKAIDLEVAKALRDVHERINAEKERAERKEEISRQREDSARIESRAEYRDLDNKLSELHKTVLMNLNKKE
ncbi:MAG: hypothetical protein ACSHWN_04805 [Methylophilaceae bacterium]